MKTQFPFDTRIQMNSRRTATIHLEIGITAVLLALAFTMKFILIDQVPGINADETLGSVMMREFVQGQAPWPWMTPSGRFLTPVFPVLVLIVNTLFPIGFGFMRLVPIFAHFLMVGSAFLLLRKKLTGIDLLLFLLLLTSLPIHTAFARVSWEPCLIPLGLLLTVFFSLEKKFILASLSLIFSIMVHTTCIFIAPLLYYLWMVDLNSDRNAGRLTGLVIWKFVGSTIFLLGVAFFVYKGASTFAGIGASKALGNLADTDGFFQFFGMLFYSFLGTISFNEFAGRAFAIPHFPSVEVLGCLTLFGLFFCLWRFKKLKDRLSYDFLLGLLICLFLFYLVSGEAPFEVGYQRYVLWLGVPSCFLVFNLARTLRLQRLVVLSISALFLWLTLYGYFFTALSRGQAAHPALYATGEPEPKSAALKWIQETASSETLGLSARLPVFADTYWLYEPTKYWLQGQLFDVFDGEYLLLPGLSGEQDASDREKLEACLMKGGFVIVFFHGSMEAKMEEFGFGERFENKAFLDSAEKPLLIVWHGIRHF